MATNREGARIAVERLMEQESLRGDLSDRGFGPLLDWGVAAIMAFAEKITDQTAIEEQCERIGKLLQHLVAAAEKGQCPETLSLFQDFPPPWSADTESRLRSLDLGEDPDANAVLMAQALQQVGFPLPPEPPVACKKPLSQRTRARRGKRKR